MFLAGGLEGNAGVFAPAEKSLLQHGTAPDQQNLTNPLLLQCGHFLQFQQHCIWDIASDTQPGACLYTHTKNVGLCLHVATWHYQDRS